MKILLILAVQSTNKPAKPIQSDNHKNDNVNGQHDSVSLFKFFILV